MIYGLTRGIPLAYAYECKAIEDKNFLQQLNSAESQWGIWVNPENPTEEFRTGQFCFENGGIRDGWVCIGSLDKLSFGFQSNQDAFASWVSEGRSDSLSSDIESITYRNKRVDINPEALYEAWCNGDLDSEFAEFISKEVEEIKEIWSENQASDFVDNELPEILENANTAEEESYVC